MYFITQTVYLIFGGLNINNTYLYVPWFELTKGLSIFGMNQHFSFKNINPPFIFHEFLTFFANVENECHTFTWLLAIQHKHGRTRINEYGIDMQMSEIPKFLNFGPFGTLTH